MRPVNEITNPALLLEFAQSKRLLQYRSAQTLADTTSLLYKIIILSDKIMPIRAYLDLLHQIQKNENNPVCFEDEFYSFAWVFLWALTFIFKANLPNYNRNR